MANSIADPAPIFQQLETDDKFLSNFEWISAKTDPALFGKYILKSVNCPEVLGDVLECKLEDLKNEDLKKIVCWAFYRKISKVEDALITLENGPNKHLALFGGLLVVYISQLLRKFLKKKGELQVADEYLAFKSDVDVWCCKRVRASYLRDREKTRDLLRSPHLIPDMHHVTLLRLAVLGKAMKFVSEKCCQDMINERWKREGGWERLPRLTSTRSKYVFHQVFHLSFATLLGFELLNTVHPLGPTAWKCAMANANGVPDETHFPEDVCVNQTVQYYKYYDHNLIEFLSYFYHLSLIAELFMGIRREGYTWYAVKRPADSIQAHLSFAFILSEAMCILLSLHIESTFILWVIFPHVRSVIVHVCFLFSSLRILGWLATDRFLGSVLVMLKKTFSTLGSFMFVLLVFWVTYAVCIMSLSNYDGPLSSLPWKIFQTGAFEIFGELEDKHKSGEVIGICESSPLNFTHITHTSLSCFLKQTTVPILLFAYIMITSLLVINLSTAFITTTYEMVQQNADFHWCYKVYTRTVDYEQRAWSPPHMALLYSLLYLPLKHLCKWIMGRRNGKFTPEDVPLTSIDTSGAGLSAFTDNVVPPPLPRGDRARSI